VLITNINIRKDNKSYYYAKGNRKNRGNNCKLDKYRSKFKGRKNV